jgi:DNA repair protein RAD51/DNA repair protein RadA
MAEELTDLDGVGSGTEEKFNGAGIKSIDDLASADASIVEEEDISISESRMQKFINSAKENTVQILSGEDVQDKYEARGSISTGIDRLDDNLGGGIENQEIVAIGGDTGAGKTQFGFYMCGQAVKQTGDPALYIETEPDRYRGNRIEEMFGEDVQSKVMKIEAHSLDQQVMAYRAAKNQMENLSFVVVDSFTSRFRLTEKFEDRSELGERNSEFRRHLNEIESMAKVADVPVLLSCQIYANPTQYGSSTVIYGSSLMMHMVAYVLMLKSKQGQLTRMKANNHPRSGEFEIVLQITEDGLRFAE